MKRQRDLSRISALLSVAGVILLSAAFFELARRVIELQGLRSRESTRELVQADFNALVAGLQVQLDRIWRAAMDREEGAPLPDTVEQTFAVSRTGAFNEPSLPFVPLIQPVPEKELPWLKTVLREANGLTLQSRTRQAYAVLNEALEKTRNRSCQAILNFEAVKVGEGFLGLDIVRTYLEEIRQEYRGALDLNGEPLAPLATRRLASLYARSPGGREEARTLLLELVGNLAANAWRCDPFTQEYLFRTTKETLLALEAALPPGLSRTRKLAVFVQSILQSVSMTGWGGLTSPVMGRSLPPPVWMTVAVPGEGPVLGGYRVVERVGKSDLEGVVLRLVSLQRQLEENSRSLLAADGGFVMTTAEGRLQVAACGREREGMQQVERIVVQGGLNVYLKVFRPLPVPTWAEHWMPWAGFLLILIALGGGTLLSIRSLHTQVVLARMRQDFIDTVSHELRTPLTSIRLNADLLHRPNLPEESKGVALGSIQDEAVRLERMVSDILDISRFRRSGNEWMHPEPISPSMLVESALRAYLPDLEARGFEVKVEIGPELPRVMVDPQAVTRALGNLVGNAGKYSGSSREILIEVTRVKDWVAFAVVDHGKGITRGEEEEIFARFFRSESTAGSVSGVGLGLAVAREIARGLGGDIKVKHTPGGGATFVLYLHRVVHKTLRERR